MNMATPTDVDRDAPVLTDLAIDIDASRDRVWRLHTKVNEWPTWQPDITSTTAEEPLTQGASFAWSTYGMHITSTVYALDEGARILWGGTANGITGIHEWTFADSPSGVHVTTTESFAGEPVAADIVNMQALLDQSLQSWLQHLKAAAERIDDRA
jgi:Polyketide cyclase / dehydrase and lipid transport